LRPAAKAFNGMGAKNRTVAFMINSLFYPELRKAERIFLAKKASARSIFLDSNIYIL